MESQRQPIKQKRLSLPMSLRRLNRLMVYAASIDKTITQAVSDWIDTLPVDEKLLKMDRDEQV